MYKTAAYKIIVSITLLMLCAIALGQAPQTTGAEAVGMSTDRLQRITAMIQGYVDEGKIAGIITAVSRAGKLVHFESVGNKGVDDRRPLAADDLFRIYSMTKPITAVAAMQLYEQGGFLLSDPVSTFLPELAGLTLLKDGGDEGNTRVAVKNEMTMHHLLTHTAGFSYGFDPQDPVDKLYREANIWAAADLDDFIRKLAELPLKFEPGEQWHYSVAADVTGLVVQRISGQAFDEYLSEHLFKPLGMEDTFFAVPDDKLARLLPNHYLDPKSKTVKAMPQKNASRATGALAETCQAMCEYSKVTLFSGGGGLVSTTADYLRFAEMLRNGGELDGARILSPKTIAYMIQNHLPATTTGGSGELPSLPGMQFKGTGFGLGFGIITDPVKHGMISSVGEYTWGGAAGTVFWIDPVEDLVVVGMMQLMGGWPSFRSDLKVAVYQAMTESAE